MKILVCGANGWIGKALCQSLQQQGHEVWQGVRQPRAARQICCDFSQTESTTIWQQRFAQIGQLDLIINAAGARFNLSRAQQYQIHNHGPYAMFKAAALAGGCAYIQISALGQPDLSNFIASKHALDQALQQLDLPGLVLRPSLVVAEAGVSSRSLRVCASLPCLLIPKQACLVQPVALSDLLDLVANYVQRLARSEIQVQQDLITVVGPEQMSLQQMLQRYRQLLGLRPAKSCYLPDGVISGLAQLGNCLPNSLLTSDSWRLLRAGNLATPADYQAMQTWLARPARRFDYDLLALPAELLRAAVILQALRYASIAVLSFLWLVTAWISFAIFPRQQSYQMLAALALPVGWQALSLNLACVLDLVLGLASLLWPRPLLWLLQAAVIVGYSLLIAIGLPEFYSHPFAPILKNLAILLLLAFLYISQKKTG